MEIGGEAWHEFVQGMNSAMEEYTQEVLDAVRQVLDVEIFQEEREKVMERLGFRHMPKLGFK